MRKAVTLTAIIVIVFVIQPIVDGQITSHYGAKTGDSGANPVGFDLTMYSPVNQSGYSKTMPLDFNIDWLVGVYPFFNWTFAGIYTYSIDNMSPVVIDSNQSSNSRYDSATDFEYSPSFSYILDISNLTNGNHQIAVSAGMYYNNNGNLMDEIFKATSEPIYFQVQDSTASSPTPTPTVPEFSWLAIVPLFLSVFSVALFLRHRKTIDQ